MQKGRPSQIFVVYIYPLRNAIYMEEIGGFYALARLTKQESEKVGPY